MRFILMLAFVLVLAAHVCVGKDLRSLVEEKENVGKKETPEIGMNKNFVYLIFSYLNLYKKIVAKVLS